MKDNNSWIQVRAYGNKITTKQDLIDYIKEHKTKMKSPIDNEEYEILPIEHRLYTTSNNEGYEIVYSFEDLVNNLKD